MWYPTQDFERYQAYIQSSTWAEIRKRILKRDKHKCRVEGCVRTNLHVHHITYPQSVDLLGCELDETMITVCRFHHRRIHEYSRWKGVEVWDATGMLIPELVKNAGQETRNRNRKRRVDGKWKGGEMESVCGKCGFKAKGPPEYVMEAFKEHGCLEVAA